MSLGKSKLSKTLSPCSSPSPDMAGRGWITLFSLTALTWLFRLFSEIWSKVQAATVKVDRVGKVLFVPKTSCRVLHPLNLSVDGLAGGVGHSMAQIGDDVLESALQHSTHLDHGLQPAAHRPVVPPAQVLARRTLIDVIEQRHRGLLQGPGSCRFQSAAPKLSKLLAVLGFHAGRVPQPVIARAG